MMRSFTERPSASDISVTFTRFGRKRRLVLRLEWLTLWPDQGGPCRSVRSGVTWQNPNNSKGCRDGALGALRVAEDRRTYREAGQGRQGKPDPAGQARRPIIETTHSADDIGDNARSSGREDLRYAGYPLANAPQTCRRRDPSCAGHPCGSRPVCRPQFRCRLAAPVGAQGRLDARYSVTLGGLQIGKGAWVIDIGDDQYTAAASGATSGLMRVFASGQGTGARARLYGLGHADAGKLRRQRHGRQEDRRDPHLDHRRPGQGVLASIRRRSPNPERVPVTDAHRSGVTDPMTGSLVRVPGNGDPVRPEACQPHRSGVRRAHALRPEARLQAHGAGQGREGLCRARWWSARSISSPVAGMFRRARRSSTWSSRATWSLARADRGHARAGAVPGVDPDADRPGRHAGDPVRHERASRRAPPTLCQDAVTGRAPSRDGCPQHSTESDASAP